MDTRLAFHISHQSYTDDSDMSSIHSSSTSTTSNSNSNSRTLFEPARKRRSISLLRRAWTKAEQESLYIAVEKCQLFGQWRKVQQRMNLDRTVEEIEEEYTRLYAEIPDLDDDEDEDEENDEEGKEDIEGLEEEAEDDMSIKLETPSLSATSSVTLSARSSQDNMALLFSRTAVARPSSMPLSPPLDKDGCDDEGAHDEQSRRSSAKHDYGHHSSNQCPQSLAHQPQMHHRRYASTSSVTTFLTRPARMVRVWTPEQSEQLKALIEFYFPGAYRINWVWVAAQMGNVFTRKQCKNKWEIMRRRMGNEDEVSLLKRGYEEFGPSWGQIQEKYLPEKSKGGISIMWDLLETREAEQQQQQQQGQREKDTISGQREPRSTRGAIHGRHHSTSSLRSFQHPAPTESLKESFLGSKVDLHQQQQQQQQQQQPPYLQQRRKRTLTSDIEGLELTSPVFARDEGMQWYSQKGNHPASTVHLQYHHHHARHGSEASATMMMRKFSTETWSDRNYPMTWTEPLTRRLEELVHQYFPNHQKVNWVKISSLMGDNPVVSRDQCKRRWYLISQNHPGTSNNNNDISKTNGSSDGIADDSMAMDMDQREVEVM
ncbi:hypothetical protein EDD11_003490 [Mortierella claussenii]|nr:hypothetical protein EDD11_003490 [Mortierella claussenii]